MRKRVNLENKTLVQMLSATVPAKAKPTEDKLFFYERDGYRILALYTKDSQRRRIFFDLEKKQPSLSFKLTNYCSCHAEEPLTKVIIIGEPTMVLQHAEGVARVLKLNLQRHWPSRKDFQAS